ncbi:MAG TPA: Gfo/Idh/MocA family oxidoreductase [Candidatus Omnitrophota bacterium]|nr:Gfo/Idh/MocA family oxidoreductase [Candidatus Omnitrophota bacterium]
MKKVKAVIVGTGLISKKKHIPAFLNNKKADLVAICDLNAAAAEATAKKFGIAKFYSNIQEMLDREKPDLVDICTPPASHAGVALTAIDAGCHVLIEKPMALTEEECDEVIRAADKKNLKICVGHSDLFYPPFIEARKIVRQGGIGEFSGMHIFLSTPTDYMTAKPDHWANKLPGGVIGESGPHVVYMTLAFINPIKYVKADVLKQTPYAWSPYDDYRISLVGEKAISTITSVYTTNQWAAKVDIWGTDAMLRLDLQTMTLVRYKRTSLNKVHVAWSGIRQGVQEIGAVLKAGAQVVAGQYKRTHDIFIGEFIESILYDRPSPVPADEGKEAVRIMNLIVQKINQAKITESVNSK